jgi:hypothetical protein
MLENNDKHVRSRRRRKEILEKTSENEFVSVDFIQPTADSVYWRVSVKSVPMRQNFLTE